MASSIIHAALQKNMNLEIIIIIEKLYYSNKQCSILYIQFDRKWHANGQFMSFQGLKSCFVFWCEQYTQTLIQRTRASDSFCSLYQIIHYIKCDMLSKSLNWELVFVYFITKFAISRFVISRFECTIYILSSVEHQQFLKQYQQIVQPEEN